VPGNTTASGSYTSAAFTIVTVAPPTPTITQSPPDPSGSTSADFSFTDSQAGVGFQCQLDKSSSSPCTSPTSYGSLASGQHTFSVRAVDAAGNQSPAAQFTWTIASGTNKSFSITGSPSGSLYPGVTRSIPLVLSNPNNATIYVTALAVSVASSPTGCDSSTNLSLTQSNASSTNPIQIPPNGSVTLSTPGVEPTIQLLNLPAVNQDACKNASFGLSYSGSAHS
jgi:hypothetical protein